MSKLVAPPCFSEKVPAPGFLCSACEVYLLCAASKKKLEAKIEPIYERVLRIEKILRGD